MSDIADFFTRWSLSHGSERGNSQRFLTELIAAVMSCRPPVLVTAALFTGALHAAAQP